MSYLNQARDPRRRTTAVAVVIGVHALIGYLLISGLAVKVFEHIEVPVEATFIKDTPKTPPPEPVKAEAPAQSEQLVAPPKPVDLSPVSRIDVQPFDPIDFPAPELVTMPEALPSPALFTPKRAAPRNDPARWVLTDDYPARLIRRDVEGTAGFRLVIGSDGTVDACEITASSGNAELDKATCKYVTRRARFDPATDGNGHKVVGSYSSTVRWQIPN
jgi:protein TonB